MKLTWDKYLTDINRLGDKVEHNKNIYKMKYVYGIPRGGVIPATIISHRLGLEFIDGSMFLYYLRNLSDMRKVLVIDDIADSGRTILTLQGHNRSKNDFICATIYKRHSCPIQPDFFAELITHDDWLVFPYEKENG